MRVFDWFLACHHRRLSRVMTMNDQTFQVCLVCGERLPYSWETLSLVRQRARPNGNAVPTYAEMKTRMFLGDARTLGKREP